jgi:hypothetical protein
MKLKQGFKKLWGWVKNSFVKKYGILWISLIGGVPAENWKVKDGKVISFNQYIATQ